MSAELIRQMKKRRTWKNQTEIGKALGISQGMVSKILRDAGQRLDHGIITKNQRMRVATGVQRKRAANPEVRGTIFHDPKQADPLVSGLLARNLPPDGIPAFAGITDGMSRARRATAACAALSLAQRAQKIPAMRPYAGAFVLLAAFAVAGPGVNWIEGQIRVYTRIFADRYPSPAVAESMAEDLRLPVGYSPRVVSSSDNATLAKRTRALMKWQAKTGQHARGFRLYPGMTGRELSIAAGQLPWPKSWPVFTN